MSIEQDIQAKGLTAPRVTPADIEAEIASEHYFTASQAVSLTTGDTPPAPLDLLTFCIFVMRNGFTIVGKSACASPENFDAELGRKIARQDAISQCWPLLGYELRTRLAAGAAPSSKGSRPYTWGDVASYGLPENGSRLGDHLQFIARMRDGATFEGIVHLRHVHDDPRELMLAECNRQAGMAA